MTTPSRRTVIKTGTLSTAAAFGVLSAPFVHAQSSEKIKIALVGCGRRGIGAAQDSINSASDVELVALADLFPDRIEEGTKQLKEKLGEKFKATPETCFTGFDSYEKVMKTDANVVLLTAPPGFRPLHLKAAINAGKHVFMEKPVAVDPVGVRSVIETALLAQEKGLRIVAGTQRRHQNNYLESMKRLQGGQIGAITSAEGYWCGDYSYYMPTPRKADWSDMEWQIRNWNYFAWLSGDIIVEQHVHNLDVLRWAMGANPVKCLGTGSRAVRTGPEFGHIYDNFNVSYEFTNGVTVLSMCRQFAGCSNRVSEKIVGSKGHLYTDGNGNATIRGENAWKFDGAATNPYVQEHTHLIEAIRQGKVLNEGKQVAESTMMAIMGRMSAYTGREVSWDWVMNSSKLDLTPAGYSLGYLPVPPVAVPGTTKLT